jgi:hypothetical protein
MPCDPPQWYSSWHRGRLRALVGGGDEHTHRPGLFGFSSSDGLWSGARCSGIGRSLDLRRGRSGALVDLAKPGRGSASSIARRSPPKNKRPRRAIPGPSYRVGNGNNLPPASRQIRGSKSPGPLQLRAPFLPVFAASFRDSPAAMGRPAAVLAVRSAAVRRCALLCRAREGSHELQESPLPE